MMENPLLEQGKLYAHMAVVALAGKCGFVGIAATVSVESTLEATVYKKGVEPPQQVVPVVQHGQLLKGVVTLVAPPFGKPPSFGGLTVRLHVARMLRHGGAPKHSKEQAEALKSMPAWMQPKDTAIVRAGRSNHASRTPTCGRNLGHPSLQPHAHSLQPHAPSVRTACTDPATAGTPSPPQPCGRCAGRCMRSMRRCT